MSNTKTEVRSPCISVCAMDDISGLCQGCYRTVEEITAWWDMSVDEQKKLLTVLEERELQQVSFD